MTDPDSGDKGLASENQVTPCLLGLNFLIGEMGVITGLS